jgi:2-hydroxyacyl-CoA lyase 1
MLHFGLPPRFKPDVKFIQLDNDPLEFGNNVKAAIPLCGDAKTILGQLNENITTPFCSKDSQWMKNISVRCNAKIVEQKSLCEEEGPLTFYSSQKIVEDNIQKLAGDFMIVCEGSNSMDIGRTIFTNAHPR